ncbi:MAG: hypothetical protein ABIL39_10660 [candidate division WOR-3 bacterium]
MPIDKENEELKVESGWNFPCEECQFWMDDEKRCVWDGKDAPVCLVITFDEWRREK